jgi:hypothetical protein
VIRSEEDMAVMGRYCKAIAVDKFRQFPAWPDLAIQSEPQSPYPEYLFLQEDLRVTAGIFVDEEVLFNEKSPEWESFCRDVLQFVLPNQAK